METIKIAIKNTAMFITALMLFFSAGLFFMNLLMLYRLIERLFS